MAHRQTVPSADSSLRTVPAVARSRAFLLSGRSVPFPAGTRLCRVIAPDAKPNGAYEFRSGVHVAPADDVDPERLLLTGRSIAPFAHPPGAVHRHQPVPGRPPREEPMWVIYRMEWPPLWAEEHAADAGQLVRVVQAVAP